MAGRPDRHAADIGLSAARRPPAERIAAAYGAARLVLRLTWGALAWRPAPQSAAQRLASLPRRGLPVSAPVEVRWNDHLVPFIAAQSDRDLATALGLVHAHLRLAQMEMMRRAAYGRLAEVAGPVAVALDHFMRLLDPTRAVPAILAQLPATTRDWLDGFVAGINHHLASDVAPPVEFRLLGIAAERWRIADVLAIARLAAADVNWLVWRRLLPLPRGTDWPDLWARLVADGGEGLPAGSNAVAVAGARSASFRPWLAGDPHLPLTLPGPWLAAAWHSLSFNVAGLMIPGLPVIAIGRNRALAWGGTNLHAASSDLFDVSHIAEDQIGARSAGIAVRWSHPRDIVLRETPYGPILTDHPWFHDAGGRTLALRWVGHAASDEISALLAIGRASDAAAFRRAAEGIAVPGQTLVVAERDGGIGRVTAAWLPHRPPLRPADPVSPLAAAAAWTRLATAADLPAESNPPGGFIVSANERPPPADIVIGWFFSPPDRARRLAARLSALGVVGFAELADLLRDVAAPAARDFRDRLCALINPPANSKLWDALYAWDGNYEAESPGALAFELVFARLMERLIPARRRAFFDAAWQNQRLLIEDFEKLPVADRAAALREALAAARPAFERLRDWGGAHRLRLAHPLGRLPWLGRHFRLAARPWPGSNDTVFKSSHPPVAARHAAGYGSNARYLFDLADPDGNYLVLLGGQDGMPTSAAFGDQTELFRRGDYVQVPLRLETARARFLHSTLLEP